MPLTNISQPVMADKLFIRMRGVLPMSSVTPSRTSLRLGNGKDAGQRRTANGEGACHDAPHLSSMGLLGVRADICFVTRNHKTMVR